MGGGMMYKTCEKCDGCGMVEADEVSTANNIENKNRKKTTKPTHNKSEKIVVTTVKTGNR